MGKLVGKIVLTGGPCAGKTTALSKIEEELTDRGFHVFIIGESASEFINGGIRPFGHSALANIDFQNLLLNYQLQKEDVYEKAVLSLPKEEKCVIICDRGAMDNKAYISDDDFHKICSQNNLNEIDLLDRYDMVLHLVTAADGKSEYYTLANNEARKETALEAIALDKKTQNAWCGHSRLSIIDNSCLFEEKLNRVLENIYQIVDSPYGIRYQKKYLVNIDNSNLDFLKQEGVTKVDIQQSYLENQSDCEARIRKRMLNGNDTFYFTLQKNDSNGLSKIIMDKRILKKEYDELSKLPSIGTISKSRYNFIYNKEYFKLDIIDNMAILEINPISSSSEISLPEWLDVQEEITDHHDFDNIVLATKNSQNYGKDDKAILNDSNESLNLMDLWSNFWGPSAKSKFKVKK